MMYYLLFSTILAIYVYFDTLDDLKFKHMALQISLFAYIWPAVIVLLFYIELRDRMKSRKDKF